MWVRSLVVVLAVVVGCESGATGPAPVFTSHPGASTPVADPIYPAYGNADIDVLHYDLDLSWDPSAKILTGRATLRLRAVNDVTQLKLDLARNFELDSVTLDDKPVEGALAADKLVVPVALARNRMAGLVVAYRGTPRPVKAPTNRTDFSALGLTVTADGSLWTMQEPFGAFSWYPVNDQPSDKALYDIAITVPAGWAGVASGTPAGRDGDTFRYTTSDPVASYLTTLAVGKYEQETATGPHGLPITYWYRAGIDDDLMRTVRQTPRYLEWLEAKFGPYPFPSAGAVIVPATSAMETQQMVTLGTLRARGGAGNDHFREGVILHEFAHHWFGNTVTLTNWNDLWLNEGLTMYAQYLFQNERDGVSDADFEAWARSTDAALRKQFGPPGKADPADFGRPNMYICPALMLHQIRKKLGDDQFFAFARGWAQDNRNTNRDRAAFIAYLNQHTGTDFSELVNTWIDSPTTPPPL